ncbi:putative tRNA N6-adenosine threonylcarbamoyltransferase, mitochondrial [Phytophthora boehmeriae]|uniref:Putative tRNA N6-adenosine threonylcarbamoyltransferase, mitochondrial n=1 Tax=Phytophthora boehmeriae TaxID=109152 RepID=A0A8T1X772_9STRA|nr:putative tRNA N6-adenosine threonylcarbamoyltransferase, mitochondrial [Phytophthora boehmeriae]
MLRLRTRCLVRAARARHASFFLGIETSCDDTAAAVLDDSGRVLSSVISSQWELNAKWKGIVPALAARAHAENLPHVVAAAIEQSGLESVQQLSAVAVTSGPGLAPCLDVGLQTARQICLDNPEIAFLQINHLEAHVLVSRLPHLTTPPPEFPFVVLLVSGGHCCLVLAKGVGDYELLGNTLDDSIGEAYDKVARMLGITASASGGKGVHGGKLIEDMAARGNDRAYPFTEPMKHRKESKQQCCEKSRR